MKTLVMLYYLYLAEGGVGQGDVPILELARWMRLSKTTVKKDVLELERLGMVELWKRVSIKGHEKIFIRLSTTGQEHLDENHRESYAAYRIHVAETLAAINQRVRSGKLSRSEIKQIATGQKALFDD